MVKLLKKVYAVVAGFFGNMNPGSKGAQTAALTFCNLPKQSKAIYITIPRNINVKFFENDDIIFVFTKTHGDINMSVIYDNTKQAKKIFV